MFENIESISYMIGVATVTIIAVLNPFGNLPLFLAMTDQIPVRLRQKLFRNILWVAFLIVLIFLFTGSFIMQYLFRVNLDSLRVAGGLVIGIMGLKNLLFTQTQHDVSNYQDLDFNALFKHSIIPMAFPILVGPGTLSTVVIIAEESNMLTAGGAVIASFLFLLILFHFSATIEKILGHLVLFVLSRIAQIFIIAVGVQMIVLGLQGMGVIKLP